MKMLITCKLQAEALERAQQAETVRRRRAADAAVRRRHSSDGGQRVEVWISADGSSLSQTQTGADNDDVDDLSSLPLVEVTPECHRSEFYCSEDDGGGEW